MKRVPHYSVTDLAETFRMGRSTLAVWLAADNAPKPIGKVRAGFVWVDAYNKAEVKAFLAESGRLKKLEELKRTTPSLTRAMRKRTGAKFSWERKSPH